MEISRYLHNIMLSHTYEIYGDILCLKSFAFIFTYWKCSFELLPSSENHNSQTPDKYPFPVQGILHYSMEQRATSERAVLVHSFTAHWDKEFFLQTFLETVFRGNTLSTNMVYVRQLSYSLKLLSYHSGSGSWYFQLLFLLGFSPFFFFFLSLSLSVRGTVTHALNDSWLGSAFPHIGCWPQRHQSRFSSEFIY